MKCISLSRYCAIATVHNEQGSYSVMYNLLGESLGWFAML